jgi:hypothetical protein
MNLESSEFALMDIDAVQKALGRSRASFYRYANTDPEQVNQSYNPQKLNPELRQSKYDALLFHPTEVSRFARDVLKMRQVTIQVQEPASTATNQLLQEILSELRSIHKHLKANSAS